MSQTPVSLATPVGEDGDAELGDLVHDAGSPTPDDIAARFGDHKSLPRILIKCNGCGNEPLRENA